MLFCAVVAAVLIAVHARVEYQDPPQFFKFPASKYSELQIISASRIRGQAGPCEPSCVHAAKNVPS